MGLIADLIQFFRDLGKKKDAQKSSPKKSAVTARKKTTPQGTKKLDVKEPPRDPTKKYASHIRGSPMHGASTPRKR